MTTGGFTLRPATEADLPGLTELSVRVLRAVLDSGGPRCIEVLLGSRARAFWERMGFVETHADAIEWTMQRPPGVAP